MENRNIQQSLIKSSDIESRLIILKRRAAEADFLREERDMLISRLKLYNPDYIWPDSGINKCLSLPVAKEFEEVQKRNENLLSENEELMESRKQLITENDDLKAHVHTLEKELEDTRKDCSNLEAISKQNEELKVSLQEMSSLKDEYEQLLIEKEQLKDDLSKLLDSDTNELDKNSKMLLKQLYIRIELCSQQYNNLLNELWSKEIQIDVLNGKISQLNAKLNEPYISAKIKFSKGQQLSAEEAYMWAIYNLEMTNKKMNCELQKVTDQLKIVTEKYSKMKDDLQPMKGIKKGAVSPRELKYALLNLQNNYDWESKNEDSAFDIYKMSERGSTAPVTRDVSAESMFRRLSLTTGMNQLDLLRENTHFIDDIYERLMEIKFRVKTEEKGRLNRLLSRIQDINIRLSI